MQNDIILSYQETFGAAYPNPIAAYSLDRPTNHHHQPPSQCDLFKSSSMKPEEDKYYGLPDLRIWNVVVFVVSSFLCVKDLLLLSRSIKAMSTVIS
jgi:hypothetical protein